MMHATRPLSRRIDTDNTKLRRCLVECEDYLAQIGETGDPGLMELASGALWDLILEHKWSKGKLASR